MLPSCWVYTVFTWNRHAGQAPPPPSHIPRSGSAHFLSPGSWETPGFDGHLLSHRGRSRIMENGGSTHAVCFCIAPLSPPPCSCPKGPAQVCVKGLQLAQSWKSRRTSKEECGRILLPPLKHPKPPSGVVSAFLFPESAKPAEAAKWETQGTLN